MPTHEDVSVALDPSEIETQLLVSQQGSDYSFALNGRYRP
jgi:hypothetical protein